MRFPFPLHPLYPRQKKLFRTGINGMDGDEKQMPTAVTRACLIPVGHRKETPTAENTESAEGRRHNGAWVRLRRLPALPEVLQRYRRCAPQKAQQRSPWRVPMPEAAPTPACNPSLQPCVLKGHLRHRRHLRLQALPQRLGIDHPASLCALSVLCGESSFSRAQAMP